MLIQIEPMERRSIQTDESMDSVNFGMDWKNEVYAKGGTRCL